MGLTGLDSKKYLAILQFKKRLLNTLDESLAEKDEASERVIIDEYGEKAVTRLKAPYREFTQDEINQMVSLYQGGESTIKIGERFGCCKTTINKMLRKQGVKVIRSKAQAKLDADKVISMYEQMHTLEEIAKEFGVYVQVISNCLHEHGVKIRNRWDYPQK